MVKLVVLYKKPEDPKAFDERYFGQHMPIANKMPGVRKVEISKITGTPMGESEYYLLTELYFDTMEALKESMGSPEGKATAKDVMSFAKDIIYMMIADVQEKVPAAV